MTTFKSGEQVEVIESTAHNMVGLRGTVTSVSRDLVFVALDIPSDLPYSVVIIDYVGDEPRITTAFRPSELRRVVTPGT